MSNVDFLEEQGAFKSRKIIGELETPAFTKFLINNGIVKTPQQSHFVMLCFALVALLITATIYGYYVFGIGNPVQDIYVIPDQLKSQMMQGQ